MRGFRWAQAGQPRLLSARQAGTEERSEQSEKASGKRGPLQSARQLGAGLRGGARRWGAAAAAVQGGGRGCC